MKIAVYFRIRNDAGLYWRGDGSFVSPCHAWADERLQIVRGWLALAVFKDPTARIVPYRVTRKRKWNVERAKERLDQIAAGCGRTVHGLARWAQSEQAFRHILAAQMFEFPYAKVNEAVAEVQNGKP